MIKCPGIATKWYSINHNIFFNYLIIMGILFYSLTSRCSSHFGVVSHEVSVSIQEPASSIQHPATSFHLLTEGQPKINRMASLFNRLTHRHLQTKFEKSAATSRGGTGPFQGPSSYPHLCWWLLILIFTGIGEPASAQEGDNE